MSLPEGAWPFEPEPDTYCRECISKLVETDRGSWCQRCGVITSVALYAAGIPDRVAELVAAGVSAAAVHPDDRMGSSLEDVYAALDAAVSAVTDLVILAQRHLPEREVQHAERALWWLLRVRDVVAPPADDGGPF